MVRCTILFIFVVLCTYTMATKRLSYQYLNGTVVKALESDSHITIAAVFYNIWVKFYSQISHCLVDSETTMHPLIQTFSACGRFSYKMYPSYRGKNELQINVRKNGDINISVSDFHLHESIVDCSRERFVIDCKDKIRSYCGYRYPWFEICLSNELRVTYETSSKHGIFTRKFKVIYEVSELFYQTVVRNYVDVHRRTDPWKSLQLEVRKIFPALSGIYRSSANKVIVDMITSVTRYFVIRENTNYIKKNFQKTQICQTGTCFTIQLTEGILGTSRILKAKHAKGTKWWQSGIFFVQVSFSNERFCDQWQPKCTRRLSYQTFSFGFSNKIVKVNVENYLHEDISIPGTKNPFVGYGPYIYGKHFSGPRGRVLNITISNVSIDSPTDDDCRYWGIIMRHSELNDLMKEKPQFLKHMDKIKHPEGAFFQMLDPQFVTCKWLRNRNDIEIIIPNAFVSQYPHVEVLWYNLNAARAPLKAKLDIRVSECGGFYAYCGSQYNPDYPEPYTFWENEYKYLFTVGGTNIPVYNPKVNKYYRRDYPCGAPDFYKGGKVLQGFHCLTISDRNGMEIRKFVKRRRFIDLYENRRVYDKSESMCNHISDIPIYILKYWKLLS